MTPCKICGSDTADIGSKQGAFRPQLFHFRHCPACGFSFVANPLTDRDDIYSDDYYAGRGADPFVDYVFELEHPEQTIRVYEWRAILAIVKSLVRLDASTRWLDFSCGNGGLIRYCREREPCQIAGCEDGSIARRAAASGIPILGSDQLASQEGTFDVVTAIEVLEHLDDPLATLRRIRKLLKPGGLFFYTTGNAAPQQSRFLEWRYVYPEVHISFYDPRTLHRALIETGFTPRFAGYLPGSTGIIRFKALKSLGVHRRAVWERMLPWTALSRILDWRLQMTAHPIAWARPLTLPPTPSVPAGTPPPASPPSTYR